MKKFSQFILEFRGSRASEKAYRLGLTSDGHGNWVDRSGRIVAQTVGGDLEMLRKKSPSPEKAEPTPAGPKTPQRVIEQPPAAAERKGIAPPKKEPAPPEIDKEIPLTIVFGRFNPPTAGHEKLIKKAKQIAAGGDLRIYPSRTQDNKKNPLDAASKIKYMRKMFPEFKDNIINDEKMKTIFDVLIAVNEDGYNKVNIVVGQNRLSEFERLANQNNGKLYSFDELKVVSSGPTDADAEGLSGMSASKLRKAAVEDNYPLFKTGLPKRMSDKDAQAMFFAVQRVMLGKKQEKESQKTELAAETWQYAPKLDPKGLREQYYQEKIFKVGNKVENLNTGLVGKVTRRGPNYLICVTEDGIMFKSWIKDLSEWTEVSGVPADQRLIGTDSLRQYTMRLSDTDHIKNFIKKYRTSLKNNK
jgi:hypothetical protein